MADEREERGEERQVAQVAIVTGGSRGIGRAVAEGLLEAGWTVRFCSRSPESVERAGRELGELFGDRAGGRVSGQAVDVRSQEQVDTVVAGVAERDGRLDCLVNNAGIGRFGPVDELSGDQWREVVETNLSGAFYFLRAAARAMKPRGRGHIFNVASLAGSTWSSTCSPTQTGRCPAWSRSGRPGPGDRRRKTKPVQGFR
jgi:NAD(P)-dependent dehydrogenase (short-subunit alcohol dehydrogenase family)